MLQFSIWSLEEDEMRRFWHYFSFLKIEFITVCRSFLKWLGRTIFHEKLLWQNTIQCKQTADSSILLLLLFYGVILGWWRRYQFPVIFNHFCSPFKMPFGKMLRKIELASEHSFTNAAFIPILLCMSQFDVLSGSVDIFE